MEVQANYIRRIEIHGLWHRYDIAWELRPDVNILSGINGVGKTTILNRSVGYLEQTTGEVKSDEKNGVHVFFDNPEATFIPYGLWHRYDIAWELRPDVNILSGINGVGKTTILNRSVGYLEQTTGEVKSDEKNGVHVFFDNPEATFIPYDVIRSYDRPLIMGDFTARMADPNVKSELDWQLYLLQRRYLDYQVNIGNKMIELLSGNEQQRSLAPALSVPKRKFQDMIDELFSYTRKKIDRKSNDIVFYQDGERLLPYKLSSGEKQMLVILLTVLVRNEEHCVLFMDEPEASLHIEWQQKLIGMIRGLNPNVQLILTTHSPAVINEEHCVLFMDEPEASLHIEWQQKLIGMIRGLNPNVQLILTTHSPAVIMEGWLDAVTEVEDISTVIGGR